MYYFVVSSWTGLRCNGDW